MRLVYVVTYDVSNAKRLRRVFKLMRGYGDHLQYSVFRCELSERERIELAARLTDVVKHDEDQVLFFSLGPVGGEHDSKVYHVGRAFIRQERGAVVI